jgi:ribose/xylose/arabinose/galactoside ABC-type transport system permease subunit
MAAENIAEAGASKAPWFRNAHLNAVRKQLGPMIGLIAITLIFLIFAPTYRQWPAFRDILEQSTVLLIMATGTTIVLISGGLDLSVGSVLALACVVAGSLLLAGMPVWLAVVAALFAGTLCGFINGMVIITTGIPTLVATLGMMMIAKGVALMIGAGKDMSRFPESFQQLGSGFVGPVLITVLAVFVTDFILRRTRLGFNTYAIGGNEEVARLAGIPVKFDKVIFYSIGGFMAALASVVQTARLDFASPNRGEGMELQAIAAVVIGGTSMFGGVGGVGRTVIGVLIVKSLEAGLIHLHVGSFWQRIAIGVVIILAVWIDRLQRREKV